MRQVSQNTIDQDTTNQKMRYCVSTLVNSKQKPHSFISSEGIDKNSIVLTESATLTLALFGFDWSLLLLNKHSANHAQKEKISWTVWNIILSFLIEGSNQNLRCIENTHIARFSYSLLFPTLSLSVNEIVSAALCGDQDLATKMINTNPTYLLQRGNGIDYLGRIYREITPFQAALITYDVEMLKIMKCIFRKLGKNINGNQINSIDEMQNQFDEIFPNGIRTDSIANEEMAKAFFEKTGIENILNNATDDEIVGIESSHSNAAKLCRMLNWFEEAVASHSKHFNPYILLEAARIYDRQFKLWNDNKLLVFSVRVFGVIQKYAPAIWWQHFAQGITYIHYHNETLGRSFKLRDSTIDIRSINNNLGKNTFISAHAVLGNFTPSSQSLYGYDDLFREFINTKLALLKELLSDFSKESRWPCVIQ